MPIKKEKFENFLPRGNVSPGLAVALNVPAKAL